MQNVYSSSIETIPGDSKYSWLNEFEYDSSLEPTATKETDNDNKDNYMYCSPIHLERIWQPVSNDKDNDSAAKTQTQIETKTEMPDYNRCFQGF